MHIPDGLMDPLVAAIGWIEFLLVLGAVMIVSGRRIRERNLPRVALLSAGIFVAQILNFPVGGGTTGHLIGAALFAILAGPALAVIGMSVVIIIQALMFGDGGVTALGLNALNMAVIAPLMGWGVYSLVDPVLVNRTRLGRSLSIALAAWASVFVAAASCAAELLVSYAVSAGNYGIAAPISVPAMLGYHVVIGIGEAAITVGLVAYLASVAPDLLTTAKTGMVAAGTKSILKSDTVKAAVAIVLIFVLVLPLYILYASAGRDGLEQVVAEADLEEGSPVLNAPFSYGKNYFETLLGGILGFLAVTLSALGLLRLLKWRGAR